MDVVRNNIDQIGGTIDVKSVAGVGVSFSIKIPLTLAIVAALIVEVGGDRFAIPQLAVVELVRVRSNSEHRIERIKDAAVLRLRDKLLPLARLSDAAQNRRRKPTLPGRGRLHRGNAGRQPELRPRGRQRLPHRRDRREADVEQASPHRAVLRQHYSRRRLGDHDHRAERHRLQSIGGSAVTSQFADNDQHGKPRDTRHPVADEEDLAVGVPRRVDRRPKAVPLALITRLEEVDARTIELSNGRHMVQYRGQLMPLVSMQRKGARQGRRRSAAAGVR